MSGPLNYRRSAFPARPWITGKLYDTLARLTILHCDAYTYSYNDNAYLCIEWRQGGHNLLALDTWLIEESGLTPVWQDMRAQGVAVYLHKGNAALMGRVHKSVLSTHATMMNLSAGRWTRISFKAHYVIARDPDCEPRGNNWTPPKAYNPRVKSQSTLPDIL